MLNDKLNRTLLFSILMFVISTLNAQDLANLKGTKPVLVNGSIGFASSFYNASGIPDRQSPFAYGINANATLTLYGISMPFSFTWYSNDKAGFRQPFNQFGISPTYKWLTVHLGYRNVSFSEFTLNGFTFLGAGVEARPGKFRLGAVYGKFNQNSSYDLVMADSIPKLTRMGWATKVGYGTDDRFVDISMLRIGDNPKNFVDSLAKLGQPTPAQNLAVGLASKFRISKNLFFHFDGSMSFFTQNQKIAASDSITDGLLKFAGNFITVNNTSEYHKALKTGLSYRFTPTVISGIEYRRIDPGFQSMGSYFFNNDLELITLNQSASFIKNKLNARGSLGLQRDNLGSTKNSTSKRVIGSLSTNYNINQNWGVDASYSNFSTNQKAIKNVTDNTLMIYQVNHNLMFMPRFVKAGEKFSHMVMLNLNWMILDDKNTQTSSATDTDTKVAMLMYALGLLKQKININVGVSYTNMSNQSLSNQLIGSTLGVSSTLLKDKLLLNWNNSFMLNKINSDNGTVFNTGLSANYRFLPKHTVTLTFNLINNSFSDSATVPSFNEFRGDIGYVFTF
ncbi:MAG: hypothetical protein IPI37_07730 [Bacteroidales bacterium]|nr:hypothetical protein [Bacteroidales bacterium]